MRPTEIRDHLRRRPFVPIRVYMSDGASHDIRHPEMALLSQRSLDIGLEPDDEGLPARTVFCDPIHITRIMPLDAA